MAQAPATPAADTESKSDKFKRLATARVNKALAAIGQLPSLANKAQYDFTDEQVAAILEVLGDKLQTVEDAFAGKKAASEGFSLLT